MFRASHESAGESSENIQNEDTIASIFSRSDTPLESADRADGGENSDSDDCLIIEDPTSRIPLPIRTTAEGLMKRENDEISGDLAYNLTVSSPSSQKWHDKNIPRNISTGFCYSSYTVHSRCTRLSHVPIFFRKMVAYTEWDPI